MCGFSGILGFGACDAGNLRRMGEAIVHRGPDDSGVWCDESGSIGLSHRRLSILELSPAGHQPMHSASGRYVIAFNGEIYNHLELRKALEPIAWRGRSDTETLLAGFDAWGIQRTLERAIGMFAFAVWDRHARVLTLARDRAGEKPVYYGWQGEGQHSAFLFGSELKALRAHPSFQRMINRGALCLLMRYNCIPAPHSIYLGISKLLPGHMLTLAAGQRDPAVATYWSAVDMVEAGVTSPVSLSDEEATEQLEALLKDSVQQQMVADVPLGAFLSGGVDSSTVVALMQAQSSRPVKTFTIGFAEQHYNEAEYAKAVARHLRTDHTELYVSPGEAMAVIPRLSGLYDEPFSDSSQIPTFLVSQLARRYVTVSLSGDAGDELFCGYDRYLLAARIWPKLSVIPVILRRALAAALTLVSPPAWNRLMSPLSGLMPGPLRNSNYGDKVHKAAGVLDSRSADDLYLGLVSHWRDTNALVIGGAEPPTLLTNGGHVLERLDRVQRMMALDLLTYLPDDILVKVDRAAMGVSLETRVPFLDHRVIEFAWRLPHSMKFRDGQGKWALRKVLYKYVPRELIERPKMGFGVPIDSWLRGPLKEWAESLLDESRLKRDGFFHVGPVRQKWAEHASGRRNWQYHLWNVLMFQAWLDASASAS